MANRLGRFTSLLSSNSVLKRLLSFDSSSEDQPATPQSQSHPPPLLPVPYFSAWFSSSNGFLHRLLGGSGPSNELTRSSTPPQPPHPPPPPPSPSFELEEIRIDEGPVVQSPSPSSAATHREISDASKSMDKLVQTVSLAVAAASIVLFVNVPKSPAPGLSGVLYNAHVAFDCLGLIASLGLSMYSILVPRKPRVAWVQRRVMVIAILAVLLAFLLRTLVVLPVASFPVIWFVFFAAAGGAGLYLVLAWKLSGPVLDGS